MKERLPSSSAGFSSRTRLDALKTDRDWIGFITTALDNAKVAEQLQNDVDTALLEMSAGQRVLTELYVALFDKLDQKALVLMDEPENHLHPSLIALFIKNLNDLLNRRRAFAIVATHSPIIVQETPSKYVTVLEREGSKTTTSPPPFETFGESIENITKHLFETDFTSSHPFGAKNATRLGSSWAVRATSS